VGPSGQAGKREKEKGPIGYGLKVSWTGSVGPTSLGSARGVSSACGSAGRLGQAAVQLCRQAWASGPSRADVISAPSLHGPKLGWRPPPPSAPPPRWLAASAPFLLADRPAPRVSLGGIRCGGARIRCGRWVCVWAPWACVCGVPGGCSGKSLKGSAATRTRCRGHVAGSSRTVRPWRGHGEAGAWPGHAAQVRTHARGSWRPRAAVWPCRARGTGIPSPRHDAAAEGDGGCGEDGGAMRLLHKRRHGGRKGEGVLRLGYGWFIGITGSSGGREGAAVVKLTDGAEEGGARGSGEVRPAGRSRAGCAAASVSSFGAGSVKMLRRRRWRPPPRALLLLLLLSWCGGGGKGKAGRLGFGGAARALIPDARVWERLRPGVLDGRAGTRGGIAAARASRARAAVKARWKGGRRRLRSRVAKQYGARASG
jgi:hypothetical protein